MENYKTLREICNSLDISRRTIQGYEKAKLVIPSGKNKYGHLLYDLSMQKRIEQIRLYQKVGFSIKEIAEFIDSPSDEVKSRLRKQVVCLQKQKEEVEMLIEKICKIINAL